MRIKNSRRSLLVADVTQSIRDAKEDLKPEARLRDSRESVIVFFMSTSVV